MVLGVQEVNPMGFLPDARNCGLRMCRECREHFCLAPRVSNPDLHDGTCMMDVPSCMPGSLNKVSFEVGGRENVPGIPGACATHNFAYLVRG